MQIRNHLHLTMLSQQAVTIRQALTRGDVDVELGERAILYVRHMSWLVQEGRHDGAEAVTLVARLGRAVCMTPPLEEDRAKARPPVQPKPFPSASNTLVRDAGTTGPWRRPTPPAPKHEGCPSCRPTAT